MAGIDAYDTTKVNRLGCVPIITIWIIASQGH